VAPIVRNEDAGSDRYICDIRGLGHRRPPYGVLIKPRTAVRQRQSGALIVSKPAQFARTSQNSIPGEAEQPSARGEKSSEDKTAESPVREGRQLRLSRTTLCRMFITSSTSALTVPSVTSRPQASRNTSLPCSRAMRSKSHIPIINCRSLYNLAIASPPCILVEEVNPRS